MYPSLDSENVGDCVVCGTRLKDIENHMKEHEKEEIIQALLSLGGVKAEEKGNNGLDSCNNSTVSPMNQEFGSMPNQAIPTLHSNNTHLASPSQNIQFVPVAGTSSSYSQIINNPYQVPPFSHHLPLKASNCSFVPGGLAQLSPSPLRPNNSETYTGLSDSSSRPIILENSPVNFNSFKSYGGQPVFNQVYVGPRFATQGVPQATRFGVPNIRHPLGSAIDVSIANTFRPPSQIDSMQQTGSQQNSEPAFLSGHQAPICMMPYSTLMHPFNPHVASQYYLCGNTILPRNNAGPEFMQGFVIPNASNFVLNSSIPNQELCSTTQIYKHNTRPAVTSTGRTTEMDATLVSTNSNVSGSFENTNFNTVATSALFNQNMHINSNNAVSSLKDDSTEISNVPQTVASKNNIVDDESAVIQVGKNVKISLPKEMANMKDKVKDLINRELVRAILLNDAGNDSSTANESISKASSSGNTKVLTVSNCKTTPTKIKRIDNSLNSAFLENELNKDSLNKGYECIPFVVCNDTEFIDVRSNPSECNGATSGSVNLLEGDNVVDFIKDDVSIQDIVKDCFDHKLHDYENKGGKSLCKNNYRVGKNQKASTSKASCKLSDEPLYSVSTVERSWESDEDEIVDEIHLQTSECKTNEDSPGGRPLTETNNLDYSNFSSIFFKSAKTKSNEVKYDFSKPVDVSKVSIVGGELFESLELVPQNVAQFIEESDTFDLCDESPVDKEEYSNSQFDVLYAGDADSVSNDSKEREISKTSFKSENGDSNSGTQPEEAMSLKASETLADSDSERGTPIEEIGMFYGKNCIFAGEAGPPNLSPRCFPRLDGVATFQNMTQVEVRNCKDEDNSAHTDLPPPYGSEDCPQNLSLTLDSNCSILGSEIILPHFFGQIDHTLGESSVIGVSDSGIWTKPSVAEWNKVIDESKNVVSSNVEDNRNSISPMASTSGLQNFEQEYDFEYESDCYGDSDSDFAHCHSRCARCLKTFKSLKEKLLHAGCHSPCVNNEANFVDIKTVKYKLEDKSEELVSGELLKQEPSCSLLELAAELSREENLLDNEGNYNCPECPASFKTIEDLHDHRVIILKSRYSCFVCHMVFKNRITKLHHMKSHPAIDLFCNICNRLFTSQYAWKQHKLFHLGLADYECDKCGRKYARKKELEIHMRKHSGERPFHCMTCKARFATTQGLKKHVITHMEGQEVECDICRKKYKSFFCLNKHKMKIHSTKRRAFKKRSDFMCPTCNIVFPSERKLQWHNETHRRWPRKCPTCGEKFVHESNLTKHIRNKHNSSYIPSSDKWESNVDCHVCNKTYKKSSLQLHMRTHTGIRPFKCDVCSKMFSVKCNLEAHSWVHKGVRERPFKCKLCERSFHRERHLEAHVRSHKNIRPFTCNECGKSFIHKK